MGRNEVFRTSSYISDGFWNDGYPSDMIFEAWNRMLEELQYMCSYSGYRPIGRPHLDLSSPIEPNLRMTISVPVEEIPGAVGRTMYGR